MTPYLPTGVSTVRIRLRQSFPVLTWWCSLVVLRHAGVNMRASKNGVSCHDRDRPRTGQEPENKSAESYKILFCKNQTTLKKKKKKKKNEKGDI